MALNRYLVLAVCAVLAVTPLACGGGNTVVNSSGAVADGISVSGTGRAYGSPDVALLQLGADVEMPTVTEAREAAASAMQTVIDSLKRNGVDEKDIQTTQFSVQPQYDFSGGTRTLRGHRVSNVVSAKIRRIDTAGKAIDDAVNAAGNVVVVRSISFQIDDPTALEIMAREEAVKEARARAEELARHSNVKLGRLMSVFESGNAVVTQTQTGVVYAPRTGDSATSIQAGELTVSVSVNLIYAIE